MSEKISLDHGAGGELMGRLILKMRDLFKVKSSWNGLLDDGAYFKMGDKYLVFTTDSYTQSPWFFPGGDIGKLAMCGTMNDLAVMGASPLAFSFAVVMEEGFSMGDLDNIVASADSVSSLIDAPVVTGDTKVMPKGELDGIIINVAGIGMAEQVIKNDNISVGDRLIVSGTVGDHGGAILAKRFGYQSDLVSDCAPVLDVMNIARGKAKAAKDPTRGGIAACLNEFADKAKVRILVDEEKIPVRRETKAICDILGLDPLNLACEGRVVFAVSSDVCEEVLVALREKYPGAADIGTAVEGSGVVMKTKMGTRFLDNPRGAGVPRIC